MPRRDEEPRSIRSELGHTLVSLSPVMILPLSATVLKERVSLRAVIGAIIAVIGAAVLFLG